MTAAFLPTSSILTSHQYTLPAASGSSAAVAFSVIKPPPLPVWFRTVTRTFEALLQLPRNWDGYGAKEIQESPVIDSLTLLMDVMDNDMPAPSIVPLSDGGVQIEWHRQGRNLEIEFSPDETPSFYFYEAGNGAEAEGSVRENLEQLRTTLAAMK